MYSCHSLAQDAAKMPSCIIDVGDVLHCYRTAVRNESQDPFNPWRGLEIVLAHFRERRQEACGVIPKRYSAHLPRDLREEFAEVVVAPRGRTSLELLESVAGRGDGLGDVLSNREFLGNARQMNFTFSSNSRFFCFPARQKQSCEHEHSRSVRRGNLAPMEFYIGSEAETEKIPSDPDRPSWWSGKCWMRNHEGAWQIADARQRRRTHWTCAECVVPFLGQSEALMDYLEELNSKLCQMGLSLERVVPLWDAEKHHWALTSLKLRGSSDSLQSLCEGSLAVTLWCQQRACNFPVLFLPKRSWTSNQSSRSRLETSLPPPSEGW
eukprot:Skav202527  [mRNA]  locus=scaffold2011:74547:75515:- [translate_table: standard]